MHNIQREVLKKMADKNIGAIYFRVGWVWPEDIRNSEELAQEIHKILFP